MPNNDHQLRLFMAVARARSLRTAADRLQLTQAALSKQIRALEGSLPGPLFRRDGRGMELTPVGQRLFDALTHSFGLVDAAMEAAAASGPALHPQVSIATVNTLAAYLLPAVAVHLKQAQPRLALSMTTASSPEVVERVARGQVDVGLVYDSAVDSDVFQARPLLQETLAGYRARSATAPASLTAQDLRLEPVILPPQPYALRRAYERALGERPLIAVECNSVSLALDLAARRLGLAILPQQLPPAALAPRELERVEIFGGSLSRMVVAITRKDARLGDAVALALVSVERCARELMVAQAPS